MTGCMHLTTVFFVQDAFCSKSCNGVLLYSVILRCTRDSRNATRQISQGTIPGVLVTSGALVRRGIMIDADDALA
jgi:hypothetical protein